MFRLGWVLRCQGFCCDCMILLDFHCSCGNDFEDLVSSGDFQAPCPVCGQQAERVLSAPRVGVYNDKARVAEALRQRSQDHSMREAKSNLEEHAAKLGGKPRAQAKWNIRSKRQSPS